MCKNKRQMTVRIDPELYAQLEQAAKEDERSLNKWVERALRKAVKDYKEAK